MPFHVLPRDFRVAMRAAVRQRAAVFKQATLLALATLTAGLFAATAPAEKFGTLVPGAAVAEFKLATASGGEWKLADRGGDVLVISVTGANRAPNSAVERVFSDYGDKGVRAITVCAGATREEFLAWAEKHKGAATHPLLWDPAGKSRPDALAAKHFGVSTYPMTLVLDRAGKFVGGFFGFGTQAPVLLRGYLRTAGVAIPPEEVPKPEAPPAPPPSVPELKPGSPAPEFVSLDLAGREVKLADFAGRIVVIDFWATWCQPCLESMPRTQEIAARTKAQGVTVLAACTSDTRASFEKWVRQHAAKYPDLVFANDPLGRDGPPEKYAERASARLYGVTGIPCQFVIGRDGRVTDVIRGYGPGDDRLEKALERLGVKATAP